MTNDEREKLIEDMLKAYFRNMFDNSGMSAALAIAERRIREDCASIASGRYWSSALGSDGTAKAIAAAILASIPETKK